MDTVIVANNQFYSHYPKRIPKGTVNAEQVEIRLDNSWDGLTVFLHWRNLGTGTEIKVELVDPTERHKIPWEVLADLGELHMGLVGLDGKEVVKPTIWLVYGYVVNGVEPDVGDDPAIPTTSYLEQMVALQRQAAADAETARKAAEASGPYAEQAKQSAEDSILAASAAEKAKLDAVEVAREAVVAASAADQANQEAQKAAATLPIPTTSDVGKVLMVDENGMYRFCETLDGGTIDDNAMQKTTTWSSRMIVDSLAPKFEISGMEVTCNPVPEYPLDVSVDIHPLQEGEGEPNVENVRPIRGWENVKITHGDLEKSVELGRTVYGGILDASKGMLTVDWAKYVANGAENPGVGQKNDVTTRWFFSVPTPTLGNAGALDIVCSILKTLPTASVDEVGCICSGANLISIRLPNAEVPDAEAVKMWLQTNGPEFVYKTSATEIIQLTPMELLSSPGMNILSSNVGEVTVAGREDPNTVIQALKAKIGEIQEACLSSQSTLFARSFAQTYVSFSDDVALSIPDILPTWDELLERGEVIKCGVCLMHNGQCYRVVASDGVIPQEQQPPGGDGMSAVYRPIDGEHAGTLEDPIPWVYEMDCYYGKYYTYQGKTYLCRQNMNPCVWAPGTAGVWQWQMV